MNSVLEIARTILHAPHVTEGYVRMRVRQRFDLTVVAVIFLEEWDTLLSEEERRVAHSHLAENGYVLKA